MVVRLTIALLALGNNGGGDSWEQKESEGESAPAAVPYLMLMSATLPVTHDAREGGLGKMASRSVK
jgi:hypothetical protein